MYIRKFNESFRKINTDDVDDFLVELEDIGFKYYIDQFDGYLDINISINADLDYDKDNYIEMPRDRYSRYGATFFKFKEVRPVILSTISLLKEKGVEFKSIEIRSLVTLSYTKTGQEKYSEIRDIEFEDVDTGTVPDDFYGCAIYLNFKYK